MKLRYYILIPISYLLTLVFEFVPDGVYGNWFYHTPVYPEGYGELTGTPSVTLSYYVHGIGQHLEVILLLLFITLKEDKRTWTHFLMKLYTTLYILSLGNYLYNYHRPIVKFMDMNYFIGGLMAIVLAFFFYNLTQQKRA